MVKTIPKATDLYLNRANLVMSTLGVWIPPKNELMLHKLYRFFMLTLQYLFLLFQIIYMVEVLGDPEEISQGSFLIFTQACLCIKITLFHIKMDLFRELVRQMNSEVFNPQSKEHEEILKLQDSRIKRLLFGFMLGSQGTCLMFALRAIFDDTNRMFPFKLWMPVSPEYSPQYELGFISQVVILSMSAFMYFGVDSCCLSMVIFACAQIEIIKNKIMKIKSIKTRCAIEAKEARTIIDEHSKILIECVVQHQAVAKFITLVEDMFHFYLLFQMCGCVGLICMSALRLLVVHWQSMQFVAMVSYIMVMSGQLFVCCWSGHELTATSESLHTVLYACCWYEQNVSFKRMLHIVMVRMSRPLVFRAGRYFTLSRQTFVTILRTSYSYFAVLKQTNK